MSNKNAPRTVASASWPTGHIGWVYGGVPSFEGAVARFLAEGLPRGERLMCIADDPVVDRWPAALLRGGELVVTSVAETYGASGVVDAVAQRRTFVASLDEAIAEGFSGLRVAADNTSLIITPERLQAWMEWEQVADRFMAENPVTGLCAFDRDRVDGAMLSSVVKLHPVVRAP